MPAAVACISSILPAVGNAVGSALVADETHLYLACVVTAIAYPVIPVIALPVVEVSRVATLLRAYVRVRS